MENELDEALASAADLAAGLAAEVRESPAPMPKTAAKDERLGLDQELAELERLTERAATELGGDQPTGRRKKKRAPAPVPDFMAEFTEPAPEPSPRPPAKPAMPEAKSIDDVSADAADTVVGEAVVEEEAVPAATSEVTAKKEPKAEAVPKPEPESGEVTLDPPSEPEAPSATVEATAGQTAAPVMRGGETKPGVVGTGMLGVVGNIAKPKRKLGAPESKKKPEKDEPQTAQKDEGFASRAAANLYPAAERIVVVLEIMDRPFGWVGRPVRRGLGLVAVATLLTSVIVAAAAIFI